MVKIGHLTNWCTMMRFTVRKKNSAAPGLITQATQASTPTSRRIMFEINPNININSKALLDMISETEVSTPASENAANAPGPSKLVNLDVTLHHTSIMFLSHSSSFQVLTSHMILQVMNEPKVFCQVHHSLYNRADILSYHWQTIKQTLPHLTWHFLHNPCTTPDLVPLTSSFLWLTQWNKYSCHLCFLQSTFISNMKHFIIFVSFVPPAI